MFLGMKTWYGQWHPCYHLAPQGSFWSRKGRSPCSTWNFHFREYLLSSSSDFQVFVFVFFPLPFRAIISPQGLFLGYKEHLISKRLLFSSVAQSCPTLCNSMDCSTPSFTVHHQLLELAQIHVHQVSDAIQPSHALLSPSPPALDLHQGLLKWVSSSHQVAKVLEFQLQRQFFQWIFRTDFLEDWLVGSPCSPRDS